MDTSEKYDEWCERIAKSSDLDHLITHFREHACEHYYRHNTGDKTNLDVWIIGVLNFMHIFEKKFPHITKEDMLFKLCTYYKNHSSGPAAPFDVDKFISEYTGEIKKHYENKNK